MLQISGPVQDFTALTAANLSLIAICTVKTTFAAHYIISISHLVGTEALEWLRNKQGTVIHSFHPINDQENSEIQLMNKYPQSLLQIPKLLKITVHQQ